MAKIYSAAIVGGLTFVLLGFQNCGQNFSSHQSEISESTSPATVPVDDVVPSANVLSKTYDVRVWSNADVVRMHFEKPENSTSSSEAELVLKFPALNKVFAKLANPEFINYLQFEPKVYEVKSSSTESAHLFIASDVGDKVMALVVNADSVEILWQMNLQKPITKTEFSQSQSVVVSGSKTIYVGGNQIQNIDSMNPTVAPYVSSCGAGEYLSNGMCLPSTRNCTVMNGVGTQTWNGTAWTTCVANACNTGYFLANGQCNSTTRTCSVTNGSGTQMWNGSAWSVCTASTCNNGFYLNNGQCLSTTQSCSVANGSGTQMWNGSTWGACTVTACNAGYNLVNNMCVAPVSAKTFKHVESGFNSSCAIDNNDQVHCWGQYWGRKPVLIDTIKAKKISLGIGHACAINLQDQLYCWGAGGNGILGNGSTTYINSLTTPVLASVVGTTVKDVSAGSGYTCVIDMQDQLRCWGQNDNGQLGNGTKVSSLTPVSATGVSTVKKVVIGNTHTCAINNLNRLYCWGKNDYGQIGNGNTNEALTPVLVSNLNSVLDVSLGMHHTCALDSTGKPYCWGYERYGQIGNSSVSWLNPARRPVPVDSVTNIVKIKSAGNKTCGSNNLGQFFCWGQTVYQSGLLPYRYWILSPSNPVTLSFQIKQLSPGANQTCVLDEQNKIYCWGTNVSGELGIGDISHNANVPTNSIELKGYTNFVGGQHTYNDAAGEHRGTHSCAITPEKKVACWNRGDEGHLGLGTIKYSGQAVVIENMSGVKQLISGLEHSCAIDAQDRLYCWGKGGNTNSLASGNTLHAMTPQLVTGLTTVKSVSTNANGTTTCAIDFQDRLHCWGGLTLVPTLVTGIGAVKKVAGTCAIDMLDRLYCLSETPTASSAFVMTLVSGLSSVKQVSVGRTTDNGYFFVSHACAIDSQDRVYCWGDNQFGQLGNGTKISSDIPVLVSGPISAKSVIVGMDNDTCAIDMQDRVYCWGGRGSLYKNQSSVLTPTLLTEISNVKSISANRSAFYFHLTNGDTYWLGFNDHLSFSTIPMLVQFP